MNKRTISTTLAALCGALVFALPAIAQTTTAENTSPQTVATTATTPIAQAGQPASKDREVPAPGSRNCIRSTGSLIPPPKGQCLPVAGRSYSQRDLRSTGALDVGHALQMLDPSVRVYGH